jgi:8-oxo-dGTP pyrophosphatase MutT (NUDIX family)
MARAVTKQSDRRLRPSAKAVVVVDGRVLVTRNRTPGDTGGDWYIFPGGGQEPGETLEAALVREVREETGIEVEPGPLLWVRELNVTPHPDWPFDPRDHCLEFMFSATYVASHGDAHEEDQYQIGTEWLDPAELDSKRFYPKAAMPYLVSHIEGVAEGPVYLGDVS